MEIIKIKTYINFARRSRNIVFGVDDILKSKKIQLVIYPDSLASSSKVKLKTFTKTHNIFNKELLCDELYELLQNDSVKAVGVTDKNLANAIRLIFTNDVSNGGNLEQNRK